MSRIIEKLPGLVVANCIGAADLGAGRYRLDFSVQASRDATAQEIASAQALVDADASAASQLATLRQQAVAAITDLQNIQNTTSPTNAQVIAAVKQLAQIQERVIRVVFQTLS